MAERIGDAYVRITADVAKFQKGMSGVQARFRKIGAGLGRIAKRAGLAVGVGLAAGAALAVRGFVNFEAEMRNVNVIAKLNEAQLAALSEKVLDLAKRMGQPPTELARALYDINSAGFAGREGLEVLEKATIAARAGITDTATAAKTITGVLNAYGMGADKASDVSDILFKTIEKGVITFPELAASLGEVTAGAAAAKVPFDQVAAAMATLTKGNIKSAQATTSLNRLIMAFVKPAENMAAAIEEAGFESGAALLRTEGLAGAMNFLQKETGGSAENLADLGLDIRALKAAMSLTRDEGTAFAADLAILTTQTERAGATQNAFEEQSKSLKVQMEKMRSTFSVLGITLGKKLAPILAKIVEKVRLFGEAVIKWVKSDAWDRMIMSVRLFWLNFKEIFLKIGIIAKGTFNAIAETVTFAFKSIGVAAFNMWTAVSENFKAGFANVKALWKALMNFFKTGKFEMPQLLTGLENVEEWFAKMPEAPTKAWEKMLGNLTELEKRSAAQRLKINAGYVKEVSKETEELAEDEAGDSDKATKAVVADEGKKRKAKKKTGDVFVGVTELIKKAQEAALAGTAGARGVIRRRAAAAGGMARPVVRVPAPQVAATPQEQAVKTVVNKASKQRNRMIELLTQIKRQGERAATVPVFA